MSKHKFRLVKTFEYEDFKKDTSTKEFSLEFMSMAVFSNDSIVSYVVKDDGDILNKWLLEHGALIGEIIYMRTYKNK